MSKFKTFVPGSWFTIAVAALIVLASLFSAVAAIRNPTAQLIVVCSLTSAGAAYIGWRYVQARVRLAREFTAYSATWDANVFAADEKARERWNFGVSDDIWRAFRDVTNRMGLPGATLKGLTIRVVSKPFEAPGLPGVNRGVTYLATVMGVTDAHTIAVVWFEDEASPYAVLCHELAHVALGRTQGIWEQEPAHAHMRIKGYPW